ncbi:hypothetical protein LSTR_LSTR004764 [Laodelphax striatellus]|uniref:Secreted peptide n=1 Tax=Laodelphax striatellus TaxID=195883 RepID=A0A482XLB9_LAOST|nr:hypothetical protein LSTR_LSTR016036 [Laodelphax striatellus]RZF46051.1 hypothetical protein LSTR_LSTR004764 [Laodelphax striatellus]
MLLLCPLLLLLLSPIFSSISSSGVGKVGLAIFPALPPPTNPMLLLLFCIRPFSKPDNLWRALYPAKPHFTDFW